MGEAATGLDFQRFHERELPELLRDGRGTEAFRAASSYGSLGFRRSEGGA